MGDQRLSYVYCTFDNDSRFYIGSRLCPEGISPEEDSSYMGSYSYEGFEPTGKTILLVSDNLYICREFETLLQFDLIRDKSCVNKALFPLTGKAKLYPSKCPSIRRKLSELRKSKPMSPAQAQHLARVNAGQKKGNHPRADKKSYPFFNCETGELFFGTIYDLADHVGVNYGEAANSRKRFANSRFREDAYPWVIAACELGGDKFSLDRKVSLSNGSRIASGSIRELPRKTGLFLCEVYTIIVEGKMRRGWKLNDYLERE